MQDELSREEALQIIARKREEMGLPPMGTPRLPENVTKLPAKPPASKRLFPMPQNVFLARGGKETEEDATWLCDVCGVIAPRQVANGYIPAECACQTEERRLQEEQRRQEERDERARLLAARRLNDCHSWLGDDWNSLPLAERTFENWNLAVQQKAYVATVQYAGRRIGNLVLWSTRDGRNTGFGTGKTHLAAAICQSLINDGHECLFTTATNLFNAFSARIQAKLGYSDLLKRASDCDLLVIDDLSKIGATDFKYSIFFEVIDKRNIRNKPTLITTNGHVRITQDDVVGISEYIGGAAASRLCDEGNGGLLVVEMNGEDYRRRKR